MRTLIVSQYFHPENFSINGIAHGLNLSDADVEVLTGQPNYPEGKTFEGYTALAIKTDSFRSMPVLRVPLIPRGKGALRLILNYLSFILSACLIGPLKLRGKRFDVIFFYGVSPILAAIPALFIGWIKSTPVVIWVQDLWPESMAATGYVKNKWILSVVERVVRFIYQKSDLLLVQSEAFVDEVKTLAGTTPVIYFPNSVDPSFAQPVEAGDRPLTGLDDKFIILFAGNIGKAQAIETIIESASLLVDLPNIHFVLVGDGSMKAWAEGQVQTRGLLNVSLPGKFPVELMPAFMCQASALLVTLKDKAIFAKTVPSKVQAYLAAGRPIIAGLNGEGARVIEKAQAGFTVRAENPQALAEACAELYRTSPEARAQMGARARAYFQAHFDHDKLIDKLFEHLDACSLGKRPK